MAGNGLMKVITTANKKRQKREVMKQKRKAAASELAMYRSGGAASSNDRWNQWPRPLPMKALTDAPAAGGDKGKGKGKDKGDTACFPFSKGFGPCQDAAPGSKCPQGRAHKCHICGSFDHPGHKHPKGGG